MKTRRWNLCRRAILSRQRLPVACSSAVVASIRPRSRNTGPTAPASRVQSCSAIATARRAKATGSSQGKADPPVRRSSATMRRPGSSTTRWPRRASSARRVDLPPPEQPEMMTKSAMVSCRFRLRLPDEAGPPRGWRNRRAGETPTSCSRRDDGCRLPKQIPGSELWIRVSGGGCQRNRVSRGEDPPPDAGPSARPGRDSRSPRLVRDAFARKHGPGEGLSGEANRRAGGEAVAASRQAQAGKRDGARDWNRTSDTAIFSRMLYQLSYPGAAADARLQRFCKADAAGSGGLIEKLSGPVQRQSHAGPWSFSFG